MDTCPRQLGQDIECPLLPPAERGKLEQQSRRVGESARLDRGLYPAGRPPIVIAPAEDAAAGVRGYPIRAGRSQSVGLHWATQIRMICLGSRLQQDSVAILRYSIDLVRCS
jgi:hypothetical protein